eukprot:UN02969
MLRSSKTKPTTINKTKQCTRSVKRQRIVAGHHKQFSTKSKSTKHKATGVDYEFALPPSPHDNYEVVIGLETHAQIATQTKAFSTSPTTFKSPPNTNTALFDAATPGTLPRLNDKCVDAVLRTGLALGGKVNKKTYFHRKQYFYCDMPSGFQITQNYPLVVGGEISLDSLLPQGMSRSVGISHIQ